MVKWPFQLQMNECSTYLSSSDVTHVVVGTARIAVARFASVAGIRQAPVFRKALVAIAPRYVALANALATENVAALHCHVVAVISLE